jgi:cobalt-zinc-cadmium efflux system outer membrane protein
MDLEAIRQKTKAFKRNLTATRLGIVPHAEVGVNTEKEIDGGRITGPTWNVEVPVWDQQLAGSFKAKAEWRQNQFHESAYEIKVQSEVREAITHLQAARIAAESYRNKIIPEREKILGLYLHEYNYMLTGVYQLLDAKQKEVLARRALIESLRDYWIALAELEKAVGGKLEFEEAGQKLNRKESMQEDLSSEKSTAVDHSHHHGGN